MSKNFEDIHTTTIKATVDIAPYRFVSLEGAYAAAAGAPLNDSIGVSRHTAAAGDDLAVSTGWSFPVEIAAAITKGAYVKPGTDGKAVVGAIGDACGQALEAGASGSVIEVRILRHIHAA